MVGRLEEGGISAGLHRFNSIKMRIAEKELDEGREVISEAVVMAERWSQVRGGEE